MSIAIQNEAAPYQIAYNTMEKWMREETKEKLVKFSHQKQLNKRKKKIDEKREGYYKDLEQALVKVVIEERAKGVNYMRTLVVNLL